MKTKRRGGLTADEADGYWWAFAYYKTNVRASKPRAHAHAWREVRRTFPHLQKLTTNPMTHLP